MDADVHRVTVIAPGASSGPAPRRASGRHAAPERLGDVLVAHGVLSAEQLAEALEQHERVGAPLGAVVLARGWVTRRQLYVALAEVWGADLTFVDPVDVDAELARRFPAAMLARETWLPLYLEEDGDGLPQVVVATAGRPSAHIAEEVVQRTGIPRVRQVVTTDWDVQRALRTGWRDELLHDAVDALAERRPDESAGTVVVRSQLAAAAVGVAATVTGLLLDPSLTAVVLVAAVTVAVAVAVGAKALVSTVGTAWETVEQVLAAEVAALTDDELPVYTILVPPSADADPVEHLVDALAALDYPREKLEVLLLLEEDDPDALSAALAAAPPELVRFVVVPHSSPRTRARACNVGLTFARGEHVVVLEAGDRPDPDQLKKAVLAFRRGGEDLVCVQAALTSADADLNTLTRLSTLERASWFDHTLAGLDRLRLPIPLGGSSNHFRTAVLRDLGGWDPANLTEDADLGIRASARGYRVAVVDSTTYERADPVLRTWLRQRSRWTTGSLQTVLVHTRHPWRLLRTAGLRQTAGFVLLVGGTPLASLAMPWLYLVLGAELVRPGPQLPAWLVQVSLATLLLGNGVLSCLALLAGFKRRTYDLVPFALLSPFAQLLHSVAAHRGLWRLLRLAVQRPADGHSPDDDVPAPVRAAAPEPADGVVRLLDPGSVPAPFRAHGDEEPVGLLAALGFPEEDPS